MKCNNRKCNYVHIPEDTNKDTHCVGNLTIKGFNGMPPQDRTNTMHPYWQPFYQPYSPIHPTSPYPWRWCRPPCDDDIEKWNHEHSGKTKIEQINFDALKDKEKSRHEKMLENIIQSQKKHIETLEQLNELLMVEKDINAVPTNDEKSKDWIDGFEQGYKKGKYIAGGDGKKDIVPPYDRKKVNSDTGEVFEKDIKAAEQALKKVRKEEAEKYKEGVLLQTLKLMGTENAMRVAGYSEEDIEKAKQLNKEHEAQKNTGNSG